MAHVVICEKSTQLITSKFSSLVREEYAWQSAKARIRKLQESVNGVIRSNIRFRAKMKHAVAREQVH